MNEHGRIMVIKGKNMMNEHGRIVVIKGKNMMNEHGRIMGEEDGRPQGAPPRLHLSPVPTMRRCYHRPYIVGTGAVWTWGGAPCGRPSPNGDSSPVPTMRRCYHRPYIVGTGAVWTWGGAPCGRPSPSLMMWGGAPCGRPSPDNASSNVNGIPPCGRLSSYIHTSRIQPEGPSNKGVTPV
jgi:hypothetical protein